MIAGLQLALSMGAENLEVYSDSQLVVNQVLEQYEARDDHMVAYFDSARRLISRFKGLKLQ